MGGRLLLLALQLLQRTGAIPSATMFFRLLYLQQLFRPRFPSLWGFFSFLRMLSFEEQDDSLGRSGGARLWMFHHPRLVYAHH